MVLGPAIAINLLSSQSLWRVDPAELSNNRSLLVHRTRLVRLLLFGAIATALWGSVLVWSALQQWGRGTTESQVRVASYLMPILAQQLVSPYTVLLFKQSRVATFALLQLILLSALLAGYVFWTSSPATWQNVLAVSLSLSVCTAAATILLTRLKAS
jgi:NAD/NADP transhydrogenase beta subunit